MTKVIWFVGDDILEFKKYPKKSNQNSFKINDETVTCIYFSNYFYNIKKYLNTFYYNK